jgi:predicted MFS family arabinose efflux permease
LPLQLIAILSIGQIIGWGTTFYLPAVLADDIARDLSIAREVVFLGVSQMVAIGALIAPACGRLMDRHGAGAFLPLGSLLIGVGLLQLAVLPTRAGYLLAWTLFGLATPLSLSLASVTLLAQLTGAHARRNIAVMMLFTGLSASVFWPITSALKAALAWRGAIVVFAGLNFFVALPLHLALACNLGRRALALGSEQPQRLPTLPWRDPRHIRRAQWLMVIAFSLQGLSSWGLPLHVISLFEYLGLASATAVGIAALNGPATIAARLADVTLGRRLQPITTAIVASAHVPLAFLLLLAPLDPIVAASAFTVIFFGASGVMGILRATLPLTLLGAAGYGALMGRLALPQNLVFAASPYLFALVFRATGPGGATLFALALSLAALAAIVGLALTIRAADAAKV